MTVNIAYAKPGHYAVISTDQAGTYMGAYVKSAKLIQARIGGQEVVIAGMGSSSAIEAAIYHLEQFEEPFDKLFHRAFMGELLTKIGAQSYTQGGNNFFHLTLVTKEPRIWTLHPESELAMPALSLSHGSLAPHIEALRLELNPQTLEQEKALHLRAYSSLGLFPGTGIGIDLAFIEIAQRGDSYGHQLALPHMSKWEGETYKLETLLVKD